MYHYCAFFHVAVPGGSVRPYPELLPVAQYGYLGVHLFFLISGFVILRSAANRGAIEFLVARVRRLFPAFLVCCTLTWLVLVTSGSHRVSVWQFAYGLTMLNGVVDTLRGHFPVYVDGVYWTLAVEWKFYALVAISIAIRRWITLEPLLWAWTAVAFRFWVSPVAWMEDWLIAPWAPYFVAGAAAHLIQQNGWRMRLCLLFGATLVIGVGHAMALFDVIVARYEFPGNSGVCGAIVLMMCVSFLMLVTHRSAPQPRRNALWTLAGALSYPIYLLHAQAGAVVFGALWSPSLRWPFLVAALAILFGAAWVVHVWVERPIWRRHGRALVAAMEHQGV